MNTAGTISSYTDRITRILPTEFVAAYLAVTQVVKEDLAWRQPLLLSSLVVCLVLIPLFLVNIKGIKDHRHILVVAFSFVVWAYALGDAFQPGSWIRLDLYRPVVGAVLLIVWGLVPLVLGVEEEKA